MEPWPRDRAYSSSSQMWLPLEMWGGVKGCLSNSKIWVQCLEMPSKVWTWWHVPVIPELQKWGKEALQTMFVGQPTLLGKFLASDRPGLRKQGGLLLRNSTWSFPLASINMNAFMSDFLKKTSSILWTIFCIEITEDYPVFSGYKV